jgi:hypothetical protein
MPSVSACSMAVAPSADPIKSRHLRPEDHQPLSRQAANRDRRYAPSRIPSFAAISVINDNYQDIQQDILQTFIDRGHLRKLGEPTVLPGGKRLPGLKLDHPRQLALMHALVRFAHVAAGSTFTTAELYPDVIDALGCSTSDYSLASLATTCRSSEPRLSSKTAALTQIPPPAMWLFGLARLPQALRAHLCSAHRRTASPCSR